MLNEILYHGVYSAGAPEPRNLLKSDLQSVQHASLTIVGEHTTATDEEPLELPDFPRSIIESVAKWMRVDQGHWTLELQFQDGGLCRCSKHERPSAGKPRRRRSDPGSSA
jgi:hypothetical protein